MTVPMNAETAERIDVAARWLADNYHVAPHPRTRLLRESFGLAFLPAVKAMAKAKSIVEAQQ